MPRLARLDASGVLHHVMGRGRVWGRSESASDMDTLGVDNFSVPLLVASGKKPDDDDLIGKF